MLQERLHSILVSCAAPDCTAETGRIKAAPSIRTKSFSSAQGSSEEDERAVQVTPPIRLPRDCRRLTPLAYAVESRGAVVKATSQNLRLSVAAELMLDGVSQAP